MADRSISVRLSANVSDFTREINRGAQSLDALVKKAGDAGGAASTGLGRLAQSARLQSAEWKTAGSALLGLGTAITGIGVLAVREFATFDQAMSGVASTGADAKQSISALREAALTAGADTAFSATEAANGLEELARAGVSAKDSLAGGLTGSLDLAAAGQLDVAAAAGIASTALTQFKLSGEDVPHVADLLAAGAGKAMGGVDDLGMALKQGGLVASQFGLSIEETVGGLSAFAAQGLLGSDAGTSLKSMLLALANPAGKTATLMQDLGINAYDAAGQFIGLEGLAGQLQDRLGGLSDAQRQAALAQIFGTDAIRAASILYDEGAEGIAEWTAAVDDSGYAARTAAELQNNLVGDLEKLGGSWSTLAITMGESANGPLREATQGLTGLLDAIAALPAPVLDTVTAIGGIAGVAALGAGGFALMLPKAMETIDAFRALGVALPGAEGKIRAAGKAAAAAGVAFLALEITDKVLSSWDSAAKSGEDLQASLKLIADNKTSLDDLFTGLDGKGIAGSFPIIRDGIDDVASSLEALKSENALGMSQLSVLGPLPALGEALGVISTDADKAREHYRKLSAELANTDPETAAKVFTRLSEAMRQNGADAEQIVSLMPEYANKMRDALKAADMGDLADNADVVADMMAGKLPEGMAATAQAATGAAGAIDAVASATAAADEEMQQYLDMLGEADASFVDVTGAWDSVIAKNREVAEAAADASKSTKDSWEDFYDGHTVMLDDYLAELQTQIDAQNSWESNMVALAGRVSQGVLDHLASLGPEGAPLVQALVDGSDSQLAEMETLFAERGSEATGAFATALQQAPAVWAALMKVAGKDAVTSAQREFIAGKTDLQGIIDRYNLTAELGANTSAARREIGSFISSVDGRTVTIYVRQVGVGSVVTAGGYTGYTGRYPGAATGGLIAHVAEAYGLANGGVPRRRISGQLVEGAGTTTSDSIAAMLSRREFVQQAAAVDYYGVAAMYALNARAIPREALAPYGFADGGSPAYTYAPTVAPIYTGAQKPAAPVSLTLSTTDVQRIADAVREGSAAGSRAGIEGRESAQGRLLGRLR